MKSTEKNEIWRNSVISCPHCKYQYLTGEIFYPNDHIGIPKNIVRDALGKILYADYKEGYEPNQSEEYICDNCNRPFIVKYETVYRVKVQEDALDFSTTEVSLL